MMNLPKPPLLTTCLLTTLLYAPLSAGQEATPPTVSPQEQPSPGKESSLDKRAADHEKVWLTTGDHKELAFYLSETTGKTYGAVLLVPDLGRHPAAQGMIYSLRHYLADNHWHTLAIKTDGSSTESTQQLIVAGINHLNQQGVFNIAILGEGAGAMRALQCISTLTDEQLKQIRALLMLNANNTLPGSKGNILELLGQVKLPVLDAYQSGDYQEQQQASKRKKAARRLQNRNYQQVRLPQVSGYQQSQHHNLTKRIRGWLDKNAAGFMVDQ